MDGVFMPIMTDQSAAPPELLDIICCSCKKDCNTKRCTCKKHGLYCTAICRQCRGISCTNSQLPNLSDDYDPEAEVSKEQDRNWHGGCHGEEKEPMIHEKETSSVVATLSWSGGLCASVTLGLYWPGLCLWQVQPSQAVFRLETSPKAALQSPTFIVSSFIVENKPIRVHFGHIFSSFTHSNLFPMKLELQKMLLFMITFILESFVAIGVKKKNKPIGVYCYPVILAHIVQWCEINIFPQLGFLRTFSMFF